MARADCAVDKAVEKSLVGLHNPPLFARVGQRHSNAFNWRPQGRIPLGIHVVDPNHAAGLSYRDRLNPKPFLEFQARVLADTLAVGSDLLPVVALNHFGQSLITSMFGAEQFMPEGSCSTLQDIGPTPLPIFSRIEEVTSLEMPAMDAGIMPDVERMALYYRKALPEWVHVVAPMPAGPFSTATSLRGSGIMLDLVDHPELCSTLIDVCARLQVRIEHRIRQLIGAPLDRHISKFGILGTGLRLGEDSIVNLSPDMIRRFALPAYDTVNNLCGGRGHIHFCSLPHSRFEHIHPVLAASSQVQVLSSQFGFEYYQDHLDELRGRLAIESFYGDAYRYVRAKYGSFRDWANAFVPRYKNESGLVLYCQVESIEEGRELWAAWEEAHEE
jgi:hypothetical protein